MKIIDAHLHFVGDDPYFNQISARAGHVNSLEHLRSEYERLGITGGVVMGNRGLEPERDRAELALLEDFNAAKKPVLGICRGLQAINVFFGGTLAQDIPGHSALEGADRLHGVRTAPSPFLAPCGEAPLVNSAHHQAADRLGSGLRAAQWAADGVVEALFHHRLPVWAVQWHPERLEASLAGRRLLAAFLEL